MIPLFATEMATRAFPEKHPQIHQSHYRQLDDLVISSIGLGTRMGRSDDDTDSEIEKAVSAFMQVGGNIIDTAIVDRGQRSERAIGRAIARELSTGRISRREIVVATKGGFLPLNESTYIDSGIAGRDEIAGKIHCISPRFLKNQLTASRENLQLEVIDLYYLHNPETQAAHVGREQMLLRIKAAIAFLEEAAADGLIRRYGVSTWSAFRVSEGESDHLELADLVSFAEGVAGARHHFRAIQVPYNVAMPGAAFSATQTVYGNRVSILEAAHELGIDVIISTPLMQGRLATALPQSFHHAFPRFPNDAQRALDFVISTPWVTSAMVGMKDIHHIEENCRIMSDPTLTSLQWAAEIDQLQDLK